MTVSLRRGAALAGAGGAAGALARYGVGVVVGSPGGFPAATLAVNVVGAFLLAVLAGSLVSNRSARTERIRLLVGTGFLGGFTTYSGLAVEGVELLGAGHLWAAFAYLFVTLLGGLAATAMGWAVGVRLSARDVAAS